MGDEHLSTIPETKSNEVIKSNVEDLVPIPSESEGIFDDTYDVPFCDNSPPLDNGDHPLPVVAQVSLAGIAPNAIPTLKDPKFWTAEEKKTRKIDHALERQMRGSEYGEQDTKAAILYEYETFKATEGEQLLDTYLLSKRKEKVKVQTESEGSDDDDISDLKKITALLAKAFNRKKYYAKPTNNNLRTSSASSSANKKPEKVIAKDCKKVKVKDYNYYKTKMLLAKKYSDEQVLRAEDQAWMESSSDSDQEINANMVFMAKMEKVLSDSDEISSFAEETIAK
nr:hypothetical protein [Tanacetum cinerariifolium]